MLKLVQETSFVNYSKSNDLSYFGTFYFQSGAVTLGFESRISANALNSFSRKYSILWISSVNSLNFF